LNLPAWYLGAGCVAQTIWNRAHGKAPGADILDYDLVYYDRDLSEERERFGYRIQPYESTEDGIAAWPTTATAIGVRLEGSQLEVWAPLRA